MNVQTNHRVRRTTNLKLTSYNPRNVILTCNKFKGAQPHLQISIFWTIERKKKSSSKLLKFHTVNFKRIQSAECRYSFNA